jgi:hypothetical protein
MADLARTPTFELMRRVTGVIDAFDCGSGTIDASNPERIAVRFATSHLGHPRAIADSVVRDLRSQGFAIVEDRSDEREAVLVLRDAA